MAFAAAASPLCTWLIAVCVSSSPSGRSSGDGSISSGSLGRSLRRRISRSRQLVAESWFPTVGIQAASLSGQGLVAYCGNGLSELGSFCSLRGCKDYNNLKHEPLFGGDLASLGGLGNLISFGTKPVKAGRRLGRAAAGMFPWVQAIFRFL